MAEIDKRYTDYYGVSTDLRIAQGNEDVHGLMRGHQATGYLELGPGAGAVTNALRRRDPKAPIVVMDTDPRALNIAKLHGHEVIHDDASRITLEFLQYLASQGIDTIVGLRIPATLIDSLHKVMREASFPGTAFTSVLLIPDEKPATNIVLHDPLVKHVVLREEPHVTTEYGFAYHP